jgi:phage terminase large subunit-like protein
VTTTPRATPLMLALVKDAATRVTRISTEDNAANLAAGFLDTIRARYGGTRLGRQELDGELIADREDGLWRREQLEALVVRKPRTAGTHRGGGRSARLRRGETFLLRHRRRRPGCGGPRGGAGRRLGRGRKPDPLGRAVARLYRRFDADCVVAEINQGGDMVTSVLRTVDPTLPVRTGARDARQVAARRTGGRPLRSRTG